MSEGQIKPGPGRHLTGTDFEELAGASGATVPERDERRIHLEECHLCGQRMKKYRAQTSRLRTLRSSLSAQPGPSCPGDDVWARYAAGLLEESEGDALLDHAIQCDRCGILLRVAAEDLNSTELPSEAGAALSDPFRVRMAAELRKRHQQEERGATPSAIRRPSPWNWAYAAAAAVVLGLVAWGIGSFGASPETLLAQAYEGERFLAARFPGASHAPLQVATRSGSSRNVRLAEAEAIILRGLEREPDNRRWQQLQGRADYLQRRYDSAIATLQQLVNAHPEDVSASLDLGTAYLARGAGGDGSDYEKSIEYLSRVLAAEPRNALAIFNRALALEALYLWDRAKEDWEVYLQIDAESGWASEARDHLRQIEEKKSPGLRD